MGGYGSGNWYRWDKKEITESQYWIDVRWLRQQGYLYPGAVGSLHWSVAGKEVGYIHYRIHTDRMILDYRHRFRGGEWKDVQQDIFLDRTPCNYGGYRPWFLCSNCGRRIAVLYGAGENFLCRHCYGLSYGSQSESKPERLTRKARNIRKRCGGSDSMFDPFPGKPKGMHWRTYWHLRDTAEQARHLSWDLMGLL